MVFFVDWRDVDVLRFLKLEGLEVVISREVWGPIWTHQIDMMAAANEMAEMEWKLGS